MLKLKLQCSIKYGLNVFNEMDTKKRADTKNPPPIPTYSFSNMKYKACCELSHKVTTLSICQKYKLA